MNPAIAGLTRIRVLHRGMELIVSLVKYEGIETTETKKSTDQRKPFGCAITRYIFPSEYKTLKQHRVSNHTDKETGNGNICVSGFKCQVPRGTWNVTPGT